MANDEALAAKTAQEHQASSSGALQESLQDSSGSLPESVPSAIQPAAKAGKRVAAPTCSATLRSSTPVPTPVPTSSPPALFAVAKPLPKPQFLLDDDQVLAALAMNLSQVQALATAMGLEITGVKRHVLQKDVIRFMGSSSTPTFDEATPTFEFPDLVPQLFQEPTTSSPA